MSPSSINLFFFFFFLGKAIFYLSYLKKFCLCDCVDALTTACLQNDVLVFAFLFAHNVVINILL